MKNWATFQHYHNRPNPPLWIKSYPALLEDYSFRQLSEVDQGRLMKVWLLAGKLRNRIPYDARYVAEVIGAKRVDLDRFVELGWLDVVDEDGNPWLDARHQTSRQGLDPPLDKEVEKNRVEKRAVIHSAVHVEQPSETFKIPNLREAS